MFNLDKTQMKRRKNIMVNVIYSRSSLQNFEIQRFCIRKTNTLLNLIKEQDDTDKI